MSSLERESLEAHVDLCEMRYKTLEARIEGVENKLDLLTQKIDDAQRSTTKVVIGAVATIVASCASVIIAILVGGV